MSLAWGRVLAALKEGKGVNLSAAEVRELEAVRAALGEP